MTASWSVSIKSVSLSSSRWRPPNCPVSLHLSDFIMQKVHVQCRKESTQSSFVECSSKTLRFSDIKDATGCSFLCWFINFRNSAWRCMTVGTSNFIELQIHQIWADGQGDPQIPSQSVTPMQPYSRSPQIYHPVVSCRLFTDAALIIPNARVSDPLNFRVPLWLLQCKVTILKTPQPLGDNTQRYPRITK